MQFMLKEKIFCLFIIYRFGRVRLSFVLCIVVYSDWYSSVGLEGNDYIYYDKY